MYLGVPIRSKHFMFGDSKSVITNSAIPNSLWSKRHHISAYHRIREAIASKYLMFIWMARPTQQTFSASIGSFLKSGPYSSHFYSGEERLLRSNSSDGGVKKIQLIGPRVSHKEIRRILGWLLLPLSSCLVPTKSSKTHPSLGAPNRTQVGVCLNNPDVPHNSSPHLYSPKVLGTHLKTKWRSIQSWITEQSWIMWQ